MRSPPKLSADVYLVLYIAAAALLGFAITVTHNPPAAIMPLAIPIILAAAVYPRRTYLLMLAALIAVNTLCLLNVPSPSQDALLGSVMGSATVFFVGTLINWSVAERARARRALAESEERLRALLNNIPDIIYSLDAAENIVTVNDLALEHLEFRADDLIGRPFAAIVHPDDQATVAAARNEAAKDHQEYIRDLQIRVLGKDGAVYWVELNAYIHFDDKGGRLQEHGVLRDITRRRRIEESLTESQRALLTLMSNLPGAAYRCRNDDQWTIEFISEGCLDLTGYRPEELIGNRVIAYVDLIHPEDRNAVRQQIETAIQDNQPFQQTYRITTRSEIEKWVWVKGRQVDQRNETVILEGFIIDITERRQAEQEVANLARFPSENPNPVLRVEEDGRISFANPTGTQLLSHWKCAVGNNLPHVWQDLVTKAVATRSRPSMDISCGDRTYSIMAVPIPDASYVNLYGRDTTESKLAEAAMQASEERYRIVSELTSDFAASFVVGPSGAPTLEWITDAFTRITGYTPDEIDMERGMSKIAVQEDVGRICDYWDKLLAGQPGICEYRIVTKDGVIRWLRDFCRPVWDDQHEHVTHIYWAVQDITIPIVTAEALWQSEHKYETLVNTIDGIVWEWDVKSQQFTVVSQQAKRLLGHAPDDWINDPQFWEDHLHPEDKEWVMSFRQQACTTMQSYESQYRMLAADGRAVWVRDMVNVVSEDGQPTQLRGIMIDTTYQKLADEETGRLNVELAQRNNQLLTLYETGRALSATLDLDEVYRVMYSEVAQQLLDEHHFIVALLDETTQMISVDFGVVDGKELDHTQFPAMPLGNGPNSETIRTRQPRIVDLEEVRNNTKANCVHVGDKRRPLSALYVPMIQADKVIGVLNVQSYQPHAFGNVDMTLLCTLANQAAVAIENAHLMESERKQLRLAQNLQAVGSLLTAEMSLNEVLERIFDLLAEVVTYESVSVQLTDKDDKLTFTAWRGFPDIEHAKAIAEKNASVPFEERWGKRSIVVIPDTAQDERWDHSLGSGRVRSWIGAPLWVKGRFIGVLNVDHTQPNVYNDSIASTVEAFANQAAIAIENARLFSESEERNQRLALINKITRTGATTLNVNELCQALVDVVAGIIGSDECYLTMWDANHKRTVPVAASGPLRDVYPESDSEPNELTLTASVLKAGHSLVVDNTLDSPHIDPAVPLSLGMNAPATLLGVPLHAEEKDLGALLIAFIHGHQFTEEEIAWAEQAGELIGLALTKAIAYTDLEKRVAERTAEIVAANERLLGLTRLKDEFVSNVSHELRTPIASIKLYLRLLTLRPDKEAAYLDRLNRETNRLEHIIEDLLQLSRMDQGSTQLNLVPTDFNKLARQFVTDRKPLAEERGLKLIFKPRSRLPVVYCDEMLLGQALSSLMTNALNYTPAGGQVEIRVRTRQVNTIQWAGLSVQDTGPGVPPGEMSRLFQRFFRGKVGQESGAHGTGLGLAIAKQIVEWHGGEIEVASKGIIGAGATFTIWLPVEKVRPPART